MFFTNFFQKKSFSWHALIAMLFVLLASSGAFAATTTIVANHSGKCLDVRGGVTATADGVRIEQWACSGQTNQAWTLQDMGNSQYEIIASNSGKCLDIVNGGTANGTAIQQLGCTGQPKQLWGLNRLAPGQYQIISISSGRCLDVIGGPNATGDGVLTEIWDCTNQANQSWTLAAPSASTTQLINPVSHKCLDVTGGPAATGNGVLIEQWACSGQSNQSWTVKDRGGMKYEIVALNSGKCLDVTNSSTDWGTPIQQKDCTGNPNQLWSLYDIGVKTFQIRSVMNLQRCLTIKGAAGNGQMPTGDGVPIVLDSCNYDGDTTRAWTMDVALPIRYVAYDNHNHIQCLDVRGGEQATADGTPVEIWTCTGLRNQLWTANDMGNGRSQFVVKNSGKCLALAGGGTGDGNKLQISQCANTPSQLWATQYGGNGLNAIASVASGNQSCLDIVGGPTASADGVLTEIRKCPNLTYPWLIGTAPP